MEDIEKRAGFRMGARFEFGGNAEEGEAAFVEQGDARRELHGFLHVVGDEDGCLAEFGAQTEEFALEIEAGDRVERAEGFVEEEDWRVGGESAGHADALPLSAGELAREAAGKGFDREIDGCEEGRDAGGNLVGWPVFESGDEADVARDGEVREQAAFLNDVADAAAQTHGVPRSGALAVDANFAGSGHDACR